MKSGMLSNVILIFFFINNVYSYHQLLNVPIGGIFEGTDENEEIAFRVAVDMVNRQGRLPYLLVPLVGRIEYDDVINAKTGAILDHTWNKPMQALEMTCDLLKEGVIVIFNSLSEDNSNAVQSVCDNKGIPVIQTTLSTEQERDCCSINLYPNAETLAKAFADVVKRWKWETLTIMYENQNSLPKITEMLKIYNNTGNTVILRQLRSNQSGDFRQALKSIWRSGQTNFVLDCSTENLEEILKQAQQIGLMTNVHKYIIINLDTHTIDLRPYQYSETNITGLRLVDPLTELVIEAAEGIYLKRQELGFRTEEIDRFLGAWKLHAQAALMIDSVMLFANALEEMGPISTGSILCNSTDSWVHGETLYNFMKTVSRDGLTGLIQFDHFGVRSDFSLELIELKEGGTIKVGSWNSKEGLNISRIAVHLEDIEEDSLRNRTFTVIIALTEPYGMLKETQFKLEGNAQYEGFGVDIINELAKLEGFNYTFIVREDKKNGDYNGTTKQWSGMIGDVIRGVADLAITDLTITRTRQSGVDFTSAFMDLGIQILYAEPTGAPPSFFTFASPFASEVWMLLTGAYFGVSLALFIMARLCYSEWNNPYPCIEEPEYLVNQFSFRNSLWFTLGGLMQQGADIAPAGFSTRLLTGFWWFFTLIMVSSYTANLAAFLTKEVNDLPFSNVDELVKRADSLGIHYGAKAEGATEGFFKNSENSLFKQIGEYMSKHPEYMPKENADGVKMAAQGSYAFFMESSSIEYEVSGSCNLTSVGNKLDEKSYGIAMRKNSPYRSKLSTAVLKLQEDGIINNLVRKWWFEKRKKPECTDEDSGGEAPPLNLKHVGGIFWVSVGGTVIAFAIVFAELALHTLKKYGRDHRSCLEEFIEEIRFYFAFKGMVKPARVRNTDLQSVDSKEQLAAENSPVAIGFSSEVMNALPEK